MQYHVFKATTGTGMAITDDKTGSKLPKRDFGGWQYLKATSVNEGDGPRIGFSSEEIAAAVARDGYLLWPAKEPADKTA